MWIIGLTGAIGAGKSTLAEGFRQRGIPVHCADAYVHHLLKKDPEVMDSVRTLWPEVIVEGKIDRQRLGDRVFSSPSDLAKLEALLYPKLAKDQKKFLEENNVRKSSFVVLDVPLLFEVGLDVYCDFVVLASAPFSMRKERVLRREGMTSHQFSLRERLQMHNETRKKKADAIVYTGREKEKALKVIQQILFILSQLPSPQWQGKWPDTLKRRTNEQGNRFRHRDNRV
jgi:dephospho-CoA kinase